MASPRPSLGPSSSTASSSTAKPDRLYIGNLSPTIDEYTLIQVLQRYGSITHLDYMFHKSGALKGKPRGYAFVQYSSKDDALKAMVKLHDRLLRGRKLVVTYASSAPSTDLPLHTKGRRSEPAKTTTLSLLKSQKRPQSAAAQIAAMEAKLALMNSRKPADEDYVPGQSFRIASTEGSPAPVSGPEDFDMDLEEELGLVEGKRAADDLEREIATELSQHPLSTGRPTSETSAGSLSGAIATTPAAVPSTDQVPQSGPPERQSAVHGLPARPSVTAPKAASGDAATPSTTTAIQRGFAGLPKKPTFL